MVYFLVLVFILWRVMKSHNPNEKGIWVIVSLLVMDRLAMITDLYKHLPGLTSW